MPVLFRGCTVLGPKALEERKYPPSTLWPYIRRLNFNSCTFPGCDAADDPVLVDEIYSTLAHVLLQMSKLRRVYVRTKSRPREHISLLSAPHIQNIVVTGRVLDRHPHTLEQLSNRPLPGSPSAPCLLVKFMYQPRILYYPTLLHSPSSAALLRLLANQPNIHSSLQSLDVPSEIAPYDLFETLDWPNMRVLSLTGERPPVSVQVGDPSELRLPSAPAHLIRALERMPRLRSLSLLLVPLQGQGSGRTLIAGGPLESSCPCPWNALEKLTVSYPHPDDALYASLPATLRSLALRCYPRHYIHLSQLGADGDERKWTSPILTSGEMLRILQRCDAPRLAKLEIEYVADGREVEEKEMLQRIASAFPRLRHLTIFRYRPAEVPEVPVESIASAMSHTVIPHLRTLRLHLDLPSAPPPLDFVRSGHFLGVNPRAHGSVLAHIARVRAAADSIGKGSGSASKGLRYVCVMVRHDLFNSFVPFEVVHSVSGAVCVGMREHLNRTVLGMSCSDEETPSSILYARQRDGH